MEPEITPNAPVEQTAPKVSKFTIILIALIVISAGFLGYLVYKSNAESNTTTPSTDSETIAEPVPTTNTPGTTSSTDTSAPVTPIPTTVPLAASTSSTNVVPSGKSFTAAQVAEKNTKTSCWTIISGNVYDITSYVPNHPGGEAEILKICGKYGTVLFAKPMEHKEGSASDILAGFKIGTLAEAIQN